MSFTTTIKNLIESSFPNHRLISNTKGVGPALQFQIGDIIDGAKEILYIYKSNWSQSFYIHLQIVFEIYTRGNKSMQIICNDQRLGHSGNIEYFKDLDLDAQCFDYNNDSELKEAILKRKDKILALENIFFKSKRINYAEIGNICSKIPIYYKQWHDIKDGYNYNLAILQQLKSDFLETCIRNGVEDGPERYADPGFNMQYYDKFRCYLIMNKLASKEFIENYMWAYWTTGRPFRKSDFVKNDYHYCLKCAKFLSRGDYIKMNDKFFGEYYEFVCAKCLKKLG